MTYSRQNRSKDQETSKNAQGKTNAAQFIDNRTATNVQQQQQEMMAASSQVTAQRALMNTMSTSQHKPLQRAASEEELQMKAASKTMQLAAPEEELLQGKFETAQRAEEEELLQGKFEAAQRAEEEELLQGKFETAQRAEEEELLQGKFETAQRAEEEELLQGKFETAQRAEEEELLQGKFETAQRAEEEELLQGKFETTQRAEEEELLQGKFANPAENIQRKENTTANNTGLPDNLKSGIENMSGYSMDDVKVHYNSDKPAQMQAHAYAQGTNIHIAPGQEQHLPHEAWHVVQQKQGRVNPTTQAKGVAINDDVGLETEADAMGAKALQMKTTQESVQQYAMVSAAVPQLKHITANPKQLAKVPGAIVQLAEWKEGGGDKDATHYWDELMDGVMWFSNGLKLWFKIQKAGKEDYSALEGQEKTCEEWHGLRKIAHPEEYPEDVVERPNYAGPLMEQYNARYVTHIKWADGSGVDELLGKNIVIDTEVKKPDSGLESVYQNSYNVQTDTFSADWNQRAKDIEVGVKAPAALYNSDLLTCHRELARNFAMSKGVMPRDDSNGFEVARHNINNSDWQDRIFPQLPIKVKGLLGGGLLVTRDAPYPFGKTVSFSGKDAVNMWEIFENMIPNTKAVFNMVAQRYPGFAIVGWNFKSGTATAIIKRVG